MANAAIQFHPDGYDTSARLMGRQSAGESFLRGFLRHADVDSFHLWNWGALPLGEMAPLVRRIHPTEKPVEWIGRGDLSKIAAVGCLYCPSPANATEAWNRRVMGPSRYSICGITHTTASSGIMDAVANLMIAPVEPWDALICTSSSVQASLTLQLDSVSQYLKERFGPTTFPKIRLETIPLGINTDDFRRDEASRSRLRSRLGIADDDIAVLYVGRFSFHGKMNPVPMAMAMEIAARRTKRKVHWIWSGWASNAAISKVVVDALAKHAPSVSVHMLDGRLPDIRFPIWSAADVFFSLSDNIQETFGLTPVEAMAAGLPCVISDWDGYKDTVRHEIDGFRIPTSGPRAGLGLDLAAQHANGWLSYDYYIGRTSQFASVDVQAAAAALLRLFEEPEVRESLGRAAQTRAREHFDWRAIVPRYQALWADLERLRKSAPAKPANTTNPWRLDPFLLFSGYPTELLRPHTLVRRVDGRGVEDALALLEEPAVSYAAPSLISREEISAIFARLAQEDTVTIGDFLDDFPPHRAGMVERGFAFLAKYNCVALAPVPTVLNR